MRQCEVHTVAAVVALGISAALVLAAPSTRAAEAKPTVEDSLWEGNPALEKVSTDLLQARRLAGLGLSVAEVEAALPGVPFARGVPEIEVRLRVLTPEIVEQAKTIGMQVTGVFYQYARIYGLCPLDRLDRLAAIPEVSTIYPNYRPILQDRDGKGGKERIP